MNKYQEALDTIKDYMILHKEYGDEDNITRLNKYMIEDLQELINDFSDCRNELCLKCGLYRSCGCGNCRWNKEEN